MNCVSIMMFVLLFIIAPTIVCHGQPSSTKSSISLHHDRIVGGANTVIESYPHQVSLLNSRSGQLVCGGSILSRHYVLTAGHCVSHVLSSAKKIHMKVRAGSSFVNRNGSLHTITKIIRHENYSVGIFGIPRSDLALIHVKEPFVFDDTRRPIDLHYSDQEIKDGTMAVVTGFGKLGDDKFMPDQLQVVAIPIVSKDNCSKAYMHRFGGIGEGEICAGFYGIGGKDACQGDSGGPLVVDGKLVGVVSYGLGCAEARYPGVYAEVSHYYNWIVKKAELSKNDDVINKLKGLVKTVRSGALKIYHSVVDFF